MKKKNDTITIPTAPEWLDENAQKKYYEAAAALTSARIDLQASDFDALAVYAQAWSDYVRLTGEIRNEGELIEGYRKSKVKNPKLTVLKSAFDRMKDAGNRLGLSPKARLGTPRTPNF